MSRRRKERQLTKFLLELSKSHSFNQASKSFYMNKMKIVILIIIGLVGLGVWYYQQPNGVETTGTADIKGSGEGVRRMPPVLVIVEPVKYQEIVDSIESIGTSHANESVILTAKVTDTVNRIHFEDGDYVEAGKILVEMTNKEESALLAEAQANLNDARRQFSRQQDLGLRGLAADSAIDETKARVEVADARYNAITARMNDRLIQAPFGGLLGFREISIGTLLTSNTPITTLDDISVIKADFSIPESYLSAVEIGNKIIAHSESWKDLEFIGTVSSIGSRIDPVTRAVIVRAIIPNEDRLLRPGMLLTIKMVTDVRQALVIPESAFIQDGNISFVYLASTDGLSHKQIITIGSRRAGMVEIIDGLNEGDIVITEGTFKLRDGAAYRVSGTKENTFQTEDGRINR